MIVGCGEDREVVGRSHGGGVEGRSISGSKGVFGDSSLVDIVAALGADEKSFVADCCVEGGCGTLEQIGEEAGVDVGLFVIDVHASAISLLSREVVGKEFGLEAFGDVVFEFELGVERVGGGPGLG